MNVRTENRFAQFVHWQLFIRTILTLTSLRYVTFILTDKFVRFQKLDSYMWTLDKPTASLSTAI